MARFLQWWELLMSSGERRSAGLFAFLREFSSMSKALYRVPLPKEQALLERVEVRLAMPQEREAFDRLLCVHHYLKKAQFVGEQLRYVAELGGRWVALLVWSAACYQLAAREAWIGGRWSKSAGAWPWWPTTAAF